MNHKEDMVLIGEALYDEDVTYKIEIIKTKFRPGSGDYEDPPYIRDDEHGEFYKALYTPPGEVAFKSCGDYFSTLDEAVKHIEKSYKGIVWHNGL